MTTENACPFCGAPLENITGSQCPACGNALPSSAPTMVSNKAAFENSAEAMDEVKKLIREGDQDAAAKVASAAFDLNQEDAQNTIEQTVIDMNYSERETPPVEPTPVSAPTKMQNAPLFSETQKPSNSRTWIIGGSIAAVVFLCLCCCLPIVVGLAMMNSGQ
jgi:hypothetical protein